jgi:acetyltransferase
LTTRNLEYLFAPASVAVIGASDRNGSVGAAVTHNLLAGGFQGMVRLVNPQHDRVAGQRCYFSVRDLDLSPQLAVICTPPATVPGLIADLGAKGTRAVIVLTAGLANAVDQAGHSLLQAMLDAARPHLLRILGPNCVGLLSPQIGLNASFAHAAAHAGSLAFVSQSGALTTALLDWARSREIGFSHFVSLGESADVDFGDALDYLATDPSTRAILLYIESIKHARKFMSAARAAARNKPIIVVKAGRAPEGAKAAASHTGAMAGSDEVYDAALRRAGALRVATTLDLFVAAETLAHAKPLCGERVMILTNGGGPGVMAADAASLGGAPLAALSAATLEGLDEILPPTWSHGNPVDIIGDAPTARYVEALKIVLADPQSDALLFLHAPTAIVDSTPIAHACAPLLCDTRRPVFSCWLGGEAVAAAKQVFVDAGLPTYDTPEEAATAFVQAVQYRRNREALFETPPAIQTAFEPDIAGAASIVRNALGEDRLLLTESEAKAILTAYGIPVAQTRIAGNTEEAERAAREVGFPVALKIHSPDISHKSDVGGVALDLQSPDTLREAAVRMLERVRAQLPQARVLGFSVQPMIRRPHAHELIVGSTMDPVFGPVILFGQGGIAVEQIADKAVALPPLNAALARDLISRTRIGRQLKGYRDRPAADHAAIELVLVRVAQLLADVAEIAELDINPLLADEHGVIALDARMRIQRAEGSGSDRFSIRPYPNDLQQSVTLAGRDILLRPIRPEDEAGLKDLIAKSAAGDVYLRFFHLVRELPHSELARFSQIDYDREMAFVALHAGEVVADARVVADPDNETAEFALLVRSDWTGKGLGYVLLSKLVSYCRQRGTRQIFGDVLRGNQRMLELGKTLGFRPAPGARETIRIVLDLTP